MDSGAVFSGNRVYRYSLWRSWDPKRPKMGFVLLNPSTADERTDDPTVSWCVKYATEMGYGGIVITNLYAVRASDPTTLVRFEDPLGPENLVYLKHVRRQVETMVVGWGNGCLQGKYGAAWAREIARFIGPTYALGVTAMGQPTHPMYFARNGTRPQLVPFTYIAEVP